MDTQRLLKVLNDILSEEDSRAISQTIANLAGALSQNTEAAYQEADSYRTELKTAFLESKIVDYAPSYQAVVKSLDADQYVGNGANAMIDNIFNGNPLEITAGITDYSQNYQKMIAKFRQAATSLENIDIVAYSSDKYEVGFLLPSEINSVQEINKHLKNLDTFLCICAQIAGEEDPTSRLEHLSMGSWEFFLGLGVSGATIVEEVLKRVLYLYKEIKNLKKINAEINEIDARADAHKAEMLQTLVQIQQSMQQQYIEEATEEVIEKHYHGPADRKPELRTQLEVASKLALAEIQKGIKMEVAPPTTGPPEGKEHAADREATKSLAKVNRELKRLYADPKTVKELPFNVSVTQADITKAKAAAKTTSKKKAKSDDKTKGFKAKKN